MDTNVPDSLQQAYDLIEAGNLEQARSILKPILESDKGNPDVWWLYAHAVSDADSARLALNNVIRLDKEYPGAFELLERLEQLSPRSGKLADVLVKEPSFVPSSLSGVSDLSKIGIESPPLPSVRYPMIEDSDEDDNQFESVADSEPFYRRRLFFIPVIGLLLLGALAVVILRPFAGSGVAVSATATISGETVDNTPATVETLSALSTQQSFSLDEAPILDSSLQTLYSALDQFDIPTNGIGIFDTYLGRSGMVDVCTKPGIELRETLSKFMDTLAKAHEIYADRVEAIGTRMLDCESGRTLLIVGVPVESAASYANSTINEADFQGMWRAIRSI